MKLDEVTQSAIFGWTYEQINNTSEQERDAKAAAYGPEFTQGMKQGLHDALYDDTDASQVDSEKSQAILMTQKKIRQGGHNNVFLLGYWFGQALFGKFYG